MVETSNRVSGPVDEHELRSVAQLRMLHALATRLNALDDVAAIGEAITTELKTLIDYHNCRIYLLLEDGLTLWPITFRGELTEYESETPEELVTQLGEGITGYTAITGLTYYAPDALHDDRGLQIEGTDEIDESLLAVPLKVGDKVTGVIVLSKLGTDQFDQDDQRVLEVLHRTHPSRTRTPACCRRNAKQRRRRRRCSVCRRHSAAPGMFPACSRVSSPPCRRSSTGRPSSPIVATRRPETSSPPIIVVSPSTGHPPRSPPILGTASSRRSRSHS